MAFSLGLQRYPGQLEAARSEYHSTCAIGVFSNIVFELGQR